MGEHCSCSEEHRKTHSLFTIKNAMKLYRLLIGMNQKFCVTSSLLQYFLVCRWEKVTCEYLMQEIHIPLSHIKRYFEIWVLIWAPASSKSAHGSWIIKTDSKFPFIYHSTYILDDIWSGCLLTPRTATQIQKREQPSLIPLLHGMKESLIYDMKSSEKTTRVSKKLVSLPFVIQTFNSVLLLGKFHINNQLLVELAAQRDKFNGKKKGVVGMLH